MAGSWTGRVGPDEEPVPVSLERGIAEDLDVWVGDELTFDVVLKEPYVNFKTMLGYTSFFPLPLAAFTDVDNNQIDPAFESAPIGQGPFKFKGKWQHDQLIQVVRYEDYAGPKKPAAWKWNTRKLALDGLAAARLRAPLLAAVIDRLQPKKVLEVGCGNGINLLSLAGHFPDVAFTGIDLTPAGIEAAKKVQAEGALPARLAEYIPLEMADPQAFKRIAFIQGSAADLPFADGEFDLVYTVLAVEQMERIRDQALAEIARVTRGHVLMLEPFRDANLKGVRRLYALSRNYFRGSIHGLERFGLEPVWATDDFPQEAFLAVLKVGTDGE